MPGIERIRKKAGHITLVNATPDHAPLLHAIFAGENVRKYSPVSRQSVAELARYLRQSGADFSTPALFYRFFGQTGTTLFGTIVVKNLDGENREAEIGFSLLDEWQGRGFGPALVYRCLGKIFAESDLQSIWATVSIGNRACIALMESLGFDNAGPYHRSFLINGMPVQQILYRMNRERYQ